ncbi:MAG TPA: type II toxin-antitoxin system VapC family toxin [Vicinamibacterales bacterium]|nr:type II toxin-antitoxin system VapC family toxin [Vicinamibacterales bacterium]
MTLRYLLDTSVVSAPMYRSPVPLLVKRLADHSHESAIAAPVWHELMFGCRRLPSGKRRRALETYLRDVVQASLPVLPYDTAAATWHGDERARLEGLGRRPPFVDAQIAAIAHANDLTLVTVNVRDFAGFQDLRVTNWSRIDERG